MTELAASFGVRIPGIPKPKGSMKCVGRRGKIPHVLVEDSRNEGWRRQVTRAADEIPVRGITGPVAIAATFTLPRPQHHYRTGRNAALLRDGAPAWPTNRTGD